MQSISGWKRGLTLFTHGIVLLSVTTLYLIFLGDMAIQPVRGRQTTNALIRAIAGGTDNIDHMRLFGFGVMLLFVWVVISIGLHSGLKNGGWLRERVDRLPTPQVRRGVLGSWHFCSQHEYKRFRREDPEGLTLLGAFWGENRRRLDLGTGRFCLGGEDIARDILTLGGPGSGKTQGIILPAIADRMLAGHSLVVADPQGEITGHILKYAAVTRHLVVVHDATSTIGPRYNLAQGIDNVSDARAIADVLVPSAQGDNKFWTDSAAALLAACLIRFPNLGEIYNAMHDLKALATKLAEKKDDAVLLATQVIGCDADTAEFYSKASGTATQEGSGDDKYSRSRPLLTVDEVITPQVGNCTIFARYVEAGFATQVVLNAQLTRFYEREDWKRRLKTGETVEPLLLERGISLDLPALPPAPAEEVKRDKLREAYQSAMDKAGEKADSARGHRTPTRFTRMDETRRKHQERKQKAEAVG